MRFVGGVFVLMAYAASVAAQEENPPLVAGEVGASYQANSGNTNNSTLGIWGGLVVQPGSYKLRAGGGFIKAVTEHEVSSRRGYGSLRAERRLPLRLNAQLEGEYYQDLPAGTRQRLSASAGSACRILESDHRKVSTSLSLIQTWEQRVMPPDRNFVGGQIGMEFHLKLNDTLTVDHDSGYVRDFVDPANWRLKSATAIEAALNGRVAIKVAHQLYRNKPDAGKRAVDAYILASLVLHWPAKTKS